jgi:hypothetical protein
MLCFTITPRAARTTANHRRRSCSAAPQAGLEEDLLTLLVLTWAIRTGRTPPDRPPHQLSETELVDFWADEHTVTGHPPTPARK